jgi:hypothetical protein
MQGEVLIRNRIVNRILLSFAYHQNVRQCLSKLNWYWDQGVDDLFIDCGAFSVATRGDTISLLEYERFVDAVRKAYPGGEEHMAIAQLDVMGDAARTRRNLQRMRKDGFNPIPIFTRGASFEELENLIAEGADYIALGNLNDFGRIKNLGQLNGYLGKVFSITRDRCKLHMFGVARLNFLLQFPFYSCDTSEGLKATGYGVVRDIREDGQGVASIMVHRTKKELMKFPHLADFIVDGHVPHSGNRRIRLCHNTANLVKMERHLTKTWRLRGVDWDEEIDNERMSAVLSNIGGRAAKSKRSTLTTAHGSKARRSLVGPRLSAAAMMRNTKTGASLNTRARSTPAKGPPPPPPTS